MMNTKWSLCPSKKSRAKTKVKLISGGSYGYYTYHQTNPGDLAVLGHNYQDTEYAATSGQIGHIQECPDDLKIVAKNAVVVEHAFTQNATPALINSLAKIMAAPLNDGNLRVRTTGNCGPDAFYVEVRYLMTALTERLLAAVSVLAGRDMAKQDDVFKAQEILRNMPLTDDDWTYICETQEAYELTGLMCRDEPELLEMRIGLLKIRIIRALLGFDWRYQDDNDDAFTMADQKPHARFAEEISADEAELAIRYINRCAIMNTISVMMKCGLVNLMQEYLLAHPPVYIAAAALKKYAAINQAAWAVELLEAYCQGDWEKIRNYDAGDVQPMDGAVCLSEKPEGYDGTYLDKKAKATDKKRAHFELGMRWGESEGWSPKEMLTQCMQCCDDDQLMKRLEYLAENMCADGNFEMAGKQFVLLNFGDTTEKALAKCIKECEGVKKSGATKKTDYIVICLSRWENMGEDIDGAIALHSEGNMCRLIDENTLWRAIEQAKAAKE